AMHTPRRRSTRIQQRDAPCDPRRRRRRTSSRAATLLASAVERLDPAFAPPFPRFVAGFWLVAATLALAPAPLAAPRPRAWSSLVFALIGALAAALAVGVLRRLTAALVFSIVLLGGQVIAAIGSAWELLGGVSAVKAKQLHDLGVAPRLGVSVNLVLSLAGSI